MSAEQAASTGDAVETTQTTQEPTVEKAPLSPLQAAVRKELGLEEPEVSEPATAGKLQSEVSGEKTEAEAGDPAERGTATEEQPELEAEPEAEEQEPAAAEDGEHEEVPDNWPKTAKARVAEEARKRRERTTERDQWKQTAEKLATQLQQATSVQLQPTKVLSEVVDKQSLAAAEAHWKEIRRFARTNPDGAEDVFIGKDAQGNEIRRDYTRGEIIKMGLDADEALEAVPVKRDQVLAAERETEAAKKVYPELFKDTDAGREAAAIVQQNPWLLQHPNYAFVIGDFLAGRKVRLAKEGKAGPAAAGLSAGAQAILGAPKVAAAPGVIKSRSASAGGPGSTRGQGGERVDTKQQDEEFYAAGGTPEALEARIKRKLEASQGGRTGGKQAALV